MTSGERNSSPARLSDDALTKMILEAKTTVRDIPSSSAEVADRISQFNELYNALPSKPDTAALIYRNPKTGSAGWTAIGHQLVVGRSPKPVGSGSASVLAMHDEEMSRQHFEVVLTNDGLFVLNDLKSLNGTYVDGVRQDVAVLVAGSEIRAGKTGFIFTGM